MPLTKITNKMVTFDIGSGSVVNFTSPSDFALGSPVYFNGSSWGLARADADSTLAQYVVSEKIYTSPISYKALINGEITLTTSQWNQVTNGTTGLTPGTIYFLSSLNSGKLSTNPGAIYAPVLRGISSTKGFVSFSINSLESGISENFYRETTTTIATTSSITLNYPPLGKAFVWLSIDGVMQSGMDFDVAGNTIVLGGIVGSGTLIDVLYATSVVLSNADAVNKMVPFTETVTSVPKNTFNLPTTPAGINSCIVFVGGSVQDPTKFSLNGNVLTMTDLVPVGVQIVAYVLNSSGVTTTTLDSFITRGTYTLPVSGTVGVSTVFGNQISGLYNFFDINDPRLSGTISLKHNGVGIDPDARIDSNSNSISITQGSSNKLNIYISSSVITFQNLTNNSLSLRFYREI